MCGQTWNSLKTASSLQYTACFDQSCDIMQAPQVLWSARGFDWLVERDDKDFAWA